MFHFEFTGANNHVVHAFTYLNEAARLSASGFQERDVGKVAFEQYTRTFWVLTNHDPISWAQLACESSTTISFLAIHPDTGKTVKITTTGLLTGGV